MDAVLDYLPGSRAGTRWDLYGGVGLFAAFLADAGAGVDCVEADRSAAEHARRNLSAFAGATVHAGQVERVIGGLAAPDVVVLDPPRSGAGRAVCEAIAAAGPSTVVYVACDPAALGRDTAIMRRGGLRTGRAARLRRIPADASRRVRGALRAAQRRVSPARESGCPRVARQDPRSRMPGSSGIALCSTSWHRGAAPR